MCRYNYSKLKGRIIELFGSQTAFAEHLGRNDAYVSRYLSGSASFTQKVIELWREALQISIEDIGHYFFMPR